MPHVFNDLAHVVGRVERGGGVYALSGALVGGVRVDGSVYDATGQFVGGVNMAGLIFDPQGAQIGTVHPDGRVTAWPRTYVGYVAAGASVVEMGGAALLLLLDDTGR